MTFRHHAPRRALWTLMATAGLMTGAAGAAEPVPPQNLLNFSTSHTLEVIQDQLGIHLQVVRDGSDAAAVQTQLKQVLDVALKEARQAAQPGALDVRTGNFSLHPRYDKNGKINGWQGQAELVLEGKDTQRVAQTAGRLQGMNITHVGYSLSRELAEKHEAEVSAEAIRKYRERAAEMARQFGFAGYVLREVSVQSGMEGGQPRPMMARAKVEMAMSADAPVPVEPGKGVVSATVSGTVQLVK